MGDARSVISRESKKKAPHGGFFLVAWVSCLEPDQAADGPHIDFVIRIVKFPFADNAELLREHVVRANAVHCIGTVVVQTRCGTAAFEFPRNEADLGKYAELASL